MYMPGWSGHLTIGFFGTARLTPPHIAATDQALAGRGRRRLAGWLACFPWRRRQPNRAHLTSALPFQRLTLWWYIGTGDWSGYFLPVIDCEVAVVGTCEDDWLWGSGSCWRRCGNWNEVVLCAAIATISVVYVQSLSACFSALHTLRVHSRYKTRPGNCLVMEQELFLQKQNAKLVCIRRTQAL